MDDDLVLNKIATIERCLARIREEYDIRTLLTNYTQQDSIILNLQRACEAAIDLAIHIIRKRKLGIPQSARDAFQLLYQAQLIDELLCNNLKKMVGFRNIAVHDYTALNLTILTSIIENHLTDFKNFCQQMILNMD